MRYAARSGKFRPELPAGFTPRLMERMRRETLRRERRETWLLTAGGRRLLRGADRRLRDDAVAGLPGCESPTSPFPAPRRTHLPHLALSEEDKWLVAMCVCIALVFLALLLADLVIRRRIASSGTEKRGTSPKRLPRFR